MPAKEIVINGVTSKVVGAGSGLGRRRRTWTRAKSSESIHQQLFISAYQKMIARIRNKKTVAVLLSRICRMYSSIRHFKDHESLSDSNASAQYLYKRNRPHILLRTIPMFLACRLLPSAASWASQAVRDLQTNPWRPQ
jgi:hypothetical protein